MSGPSKIEWTERTWNPIVGCSIVSPGCTHCYAMKTARRIELMNEALVAEGKPGAAHYAGTTKMVNGNAVWTGKLALAPEHILLEPLRRRKPTTYFVNSMGDLFHEDCPDEWIDLVFAVMALSPQHTFQVLTKRAARMRSWFEPFCRRRADGLGKSVLALGYDGPLEALPWPLPNVWLGVSTERQQEADERIPLLLDTPAAVRFISAEPLLGHISLYALSMATTAPSDALRGLRHVPDDSRDGGYNANTNKLDWVIVGGESGPGARSMHPAWVRSLRDQCAAAGVAFFFKQWGAWAPSTPEQASGNPRSGWKALAGYPHVAKAADLYPEAGAEFVACLGKKTAGRLLDGIEHNGMPGAAA